MDEEDSAESLWPLVIQRGADPVSAAQSAASWSSATAPSVTRAANTRRRQRDRWRHNHALTLLTETHTGKNTAVSGIDLALFGRLVLGRTPPCDTFPFLCASAAEANGCSIMTVTHLSDSWMRGKNKLRLKGLCGIDPRSRACIHLPLLDRL